jgi:hypothetical protein
MFTVLAVFPSSMSAIDIKQPQSTLSNESIIKRFEEINRKYDVGELLSDEDAAFIKQYANYISSDYVTDNETMIQPMAMEYFYGKGSRNGISAAVLGTYNINMGAVNTDYTISMTTAISSGSPTKITNKYEHAAYGIIGSGGIGKVYSTTDNNSCSNSKSCYSLFENEYFALGNVYAVTLIKSTIYYNGGSFDIKVEEL